MVGQFCEASENCFHYHTQCLIEITTGVKSQCLHTRFHYMRLLYEFVPTNVRTCDWEGNCLRESVGCSMRIILWERDESKTGCNGYCTFHDKYGFYPTIAECLTNKLLSSSQHSKYSCLLMLSLYVCKTSLLNSVLLKFLLEILNNNQGICLM
jgi:hypothetical protein